MEFNDLVSKNSFRNYALKILNQQIVDTFNVQFF